MDLINAGTLIGLAVLVIGYGAVSQYDLQISDLGAYNPDRWRQTVWFGSITLVLYSLPLYPLLYWWTPHLSWDIFDVDNIGEWVLVWISVVIAGFILPRYAGRYVGHYTKRKASKLFENTDKDIAPKQGWRPDLPSSLEYTWQYLAYGECIFACCKLKTGRTITGTVRHGSCYPYPRDLYLCEVTFYDESGTPLSPGLTGADPADHMDKQSPEGVWIALDSIEYIIHYRSEYASTNAKET